MGFAYSADTDGALQSTAMGYGVNGQIAVPAGGQLKVPTPR